MITEKKNQLMGAHTSTQGGVAASVDLAQKLGFTAMQIFTKNNNRWEAKPLTDEEIEKYKEKLAASEIKYVVSHDSYLINLCAPDPIMLDKSRRAFLDELQRCEQLGIPHLNFHPGAHLGKGEEEGIRIIAESLNMAHDKTPGYNVKSMLEVTAGQGSAIGYKFEHIRDIIDQVKNKSRMAVCIDTAHVYAAGYDISEDYENVIRMFDDIIGLAYLQCFHINDSKKALGSRVDRHEHIGKGTIGVKGFANILNDQRLLHIPKVLETPKGKEQLEDLENLEVLRGLIV
ncbi:MAG: deoxyribonuclease IV [Ignavibacteriaceae bacterium]|nr:deoxyribonuclease IV [Ignavibacteriaceae bacterium]